MKSILQYSGFLILIVALLSGCGPSKKEQQRREQARQDSLAQVRKDSLARVQQNRMADMRADSLNKANQDQTNMPANVSFNSNGRFTVQVESWRSQVKAQQEARKWKKRGFQNAFVVQYGNEKTGDVWYRVRLGRLGSKQDAKQLQEALQDKYQMKSWIGTAR